jgi:hypothetical protein
MTPSVTGQKNSEFLDFQRSSRGGFGEFWTIDETLFSKFNPKSFGEAAEQQNALKNILNPFIYPNSGQLQDIKQTCCID